MNVNLYKLLPRRLLSKLMYRVARIETPWAKNLIIRLYMRLTGADTSFAAQTNPLAYRSLNDFFTRALKDNARPIDNNPAHIVSPVDGRCAQYGKIEQNTLIQAKGISYTLETLLGDPDLAPTFYNGHTATLYLAPDDYHRIHMPLDGQLTQMRFCPGDKHSVALSLLDKIPNIFAGNERVVCLFDTDIGPMAVILVGALNVSSIETVWHGEVTAQANNHYHYQAQAYPKGAEIGRFNLGSTVILLFTEQASKQSFTWQSALFDSAEKIRMGQTIASLDKTTS